MIGGANGDCTRCSYIPAATPGGICVLCSKEREGHRQGIRDSITALEQYTNDNHRHVGRWFCSPGSGDRCDITAALRDATDRLHKLLEKA